MGPGKAELIERITKTGSISATTRAIRISYHQAWQLVEALNRDYRRRVIDTATGGKRGGGARVTPFGREILGLFRTMEDQA